MSSGNLRVVGIVCLVVCGICLFVAFERYQANADNVAAMNEMGRGFPGSPFGGSAMKPATPTGTKYALVFALVSGISGMVLIVKSRKDPGSG